MSKNLTLGLFISCTICIFFALLLPNSALEKEAGFFSFIPHFDRLVHFLMFCTFTYLLVRLLLFYDLDFKKILYLSFFIALCFGVFTEFLQLWTFELFQRTFDIKDIYADGVGAIVALVVVLWTYKE